MATPNAKPLIKSKFFVVAIPYLWLFLFFLAPFLIVLKISLSQTAMGMPR